MDFVKWDKRRRMLAISFLASVSSCGGAFVENDGDRNTKIDTLKSQIWQKHYNVRKFQIWSVYYPLVCWSSYWMNSKHLKPPWIHDKWQCVSALPTCITGIRSLPSTPCNWAPRSVPGICTPKLMSRNASGPAIMMFSLHLPKPRAEAVPNMAGITSRPYADVITPSHLVRIVGSSAGLTQLEL